jgi:hypothetical protein
VLVWLQADPGIAVVVQVSYQSSIPFLYFGLLVSSRPNLTLQIPHVASAKIVVVRTFLVHANCPHHVSRLSVNEAK